MDTLCVMYGSGRPRIGVVADHRYVTVGAWERVEAALVPNSYVRLIARAGGLPVILPVDRSLIEDTIGAIEMLDGLVLIGGRDLAAATYLQSDHPANDPADELSALRDELELGLTRAALEVELPLLGICRGVQVLNVIAGGDLEQHLGDRVQLETHRNRIGEFTRHPVRLLRGSLLHEIFDAATIEVASHHHQGIGQLGHGLVPAAFAPDGVVEAVERPAGQFCVGVLWHPEEDVDGRGLPLFAGLVAAAHARAQACDPAA
jgi:putative glutamine amidotransferase